MMDALEVSVVVPLLNEEKNVPPLVERVRDALGRARDWELILVDDGSTDRTRALAEELAAEDPRIRVVGLARRYGQSTAMQAGFDAARGAIIVTMDGDLQNDPRDIPVLVDKLEEGYDLVAGYRQRRKDHFLTRKVPSWVANRIIQLITGVPIRDNGCSLKAYRSELLDRFRLYSDLHRFIPAMAAGTAGARIAEVPVRHHPRVMGESKYGLSRVGKVLVDLFVVLMIRSFRNQPLTLFGVGALLFGVLGVGFMLTGLAVTLASGDGFGSTLVFPSVGLVWIALAAFLMMVGLIGEVAVRESMTREPDLPLMVHEDSGSGGAVR